jgi:hypothetical protein
MALFASIACSEPRDTEPSVEVGGASSTAEGDSDSTTSPDSTPSTSPTSSSGTSATSSPVATESGNTPPVLDVGAPDTEGPEPTGADNGCTKVDFLLVVQSSSAGTHYGGQNLISNFTDFVEEASASLNLDYHVGLVASDEYAGNPDECQQLGALVTSTAGNASSNAVCTPFAGGGRFLTNEDDDFADKFSCVATLGTEGSHLERLMNAMEAAVSPELGMPGGCNEGFLRDDALLVVVLVAPEFDGPGDPEGAGSSGNASTWRETLLAAKGDSEERVMVLTLSFIREGDCPPGDIYFDPGDIQDFAESFSDNGLHRCVSSDFALTFMDTQELLAERCQMFVPPG